MVIFCVRLGRTLKIIRKKFMNMSPEKQKHYEQLYEEMYQASLSGQTTPVPAELSDPVEGRNFLNWRHTFSVAFTRKAAAAYRAWLDLQQAPMTLAEAPAPSPSKK